MTQQYNPVTWQDETTSQQGTLINAERLNQMQTAHHYADGFEEVDTIPTADPGVAYHKIVYCTADSTFYRWDGTEWTKDVDDDTKALLEQEIARATEAEGELAQDIADETTARETADTAMQADITAMQSGKLDKQTAGLNQTQVYAVRGSTQRMLTAGASSGDIPLYNIEHTLFAKMPSAFDPTDETVVNYGWATAQIGAEATARAEADTLLGDRITAEATAREGADTALGNRITAEETRATQAEQANAQAIANTYTKGETDTLLGAKADQATTYTKSETDTLVQNALDGYLPMVRTTGNQAVGGVKDFTSQLTVTGIWDNNISHNLESSSTWRRIYHTTTATLSNLVLTLLVSPQKGNNDEAGIIVFYATTAGVTARWLIKGLGAVNNNYCIVKTSGNLYEIWAKNADGNRGLSFIRLNETTWGNITNNWMRDLTTKDASFDPTTYAGYAYPSEDNIVHTIGNETIDGAKTFTGTMLATGQPAYSASLPATTVATIGTLDAYSPMVRTSGAQTIGGAKMFTDRIQAAANYGTGGVSTSMTAGQYNTVFILPKANISAFRGVIFAVAFRRAVGTNPVFVSIAFHGVTAVAISKWGDTSTTEFFTSEDNDNVYIGVKAKTNGLDANSIQMILLNAVGFNYTPVANNSTGVPTDAPPGTLIAETS